MYGKLNRYLLLSLVICLPLFIPPQILAKDVWSAIRLPVPARDRDRHYLGLSKGETFALEQIDADLIVVQVYSMYCPICQREAERVNTLFDQIIGNTKIAAKTRVLGIGVGNSAYEVDFYRSTYNVLFPLFADGKYKLHQLLGEVGTPYFYLLQRDRNGRLEQVYAKSGAFESIEGFMDLIRERVE